MLGQSSISSATEKQIGEEKALGISDLIIPIEDVTPKVTDNSQSIQERDLHAAKTLVSISEEVIAKDSDLNDITKLSSSSTSAISPPDRQKKTKPVVKSSEEVVTNVRNKSKSKSDSDSEDNYSE